MNPNLPLTTVVPNILSWLPDRSASAQALCQFLTAAGYAREDIQTHLRQGLERGTYILGQSLDITLPEEIPQ